MLTVAFATAQIHTVYQGQTTELGVEQKGSDTYTWDIYNDPNVNFAMVSGNAPTDEADFVGSNNGATVTVRWLSPGIYFYRALAIDETGCTNNLKIGMLEVLESLPTAELELNPNEICLNEAATITVALTGNPAWSFVLEAEDEDGIIEETTHENIEEDSYEVTVSPNQTTIYRVTDLKDQYGENLDPSDNVTLTVHPLPVSSKIYLKVKE